MLVRANEIFCIGRVIQKLIRKIHGRPRTLNLWHLFGEMEVKHVFLTVGRLEAPNDQLKC